MNSATAQPDWIAVDWGTSHLRLWRMTGAGTLISRTGSDQGMGKLARTGFEPVLLDLLRRDLSPQRRLTVICCGMVGARQGWAEAHYTPVPARPPGIRSATSVVTESENLSVHILPGMSQNSPPDVMRGEETQIAGFLAAEPDFDGVLCLPGTHCKWAQISAGEVVSFRTFLTGELFALLAGQSVLRHSIAPSGMDQASFTEAVERAISRPQSLAGDLFSLRADALLQGLDPVAARSRLSGLLIGAELSASRPYWLGQNIVIVGESAVAAAYETALRAQGAVPRRVDAEAMTLNGLRAAYAELKEHAR